MWARITSEVFVNTPSKCAGRDVKGCRPRAPGDQRFTGIDDPYEEPLNPELTWYVETTPEANARKIVAYLEARGF